ncbi:MAG: thiopurine S-methyltransferase [Alphaproteobacteria bacterium]|nr:thiopurine S-methyltransferase [Alphaproteobacteria bacterium]
MEPEFWLDRWRQSQIGFHQADTNPLLQRYWPMLSLETPSIVFVPLCGKSLDMVWLAGQGHHVIGIELSEIAIDEFFADLGLSPSIRREQDFTVKSAGPYELWCGDFFAMPAVTTASIAAIYDRASLIALPPAMRRHYAEKLIDLNRSGARTLLITLEYDQSVLPGPPHSVTSEEVRELFSHAWETIELERAETAAISPKFREHGLDTVIQTAYLMVPRAVSSGTAGR